MTIDTPERNYIAWLNQVEVWLNRVGLNSTDTEFDSYNWHAAWVTGLSPLAAVHHAREMIGAQR